MRKLPLRLLLVLAACIGLLAALTLILRGSPLHEARSHTTICRTADAGPNRREAIEDPHDDLRHAEAEKPSSVSIPIPGKQEIDTTLALDVRRQLALLEQLIQENRRRPGMSGNAMIKSELEMVGFLTQTALSSPSVACPEILMAFSARSADPLFRAYLALTLGLSDGSGHVKEHLQDWWQDSTGIIAESALIGSFLKSLKRNEPQGIQVVWERISYSGILSHELSYAGFSLAAEMHGAFNETSFRETFIRIPSADETRALIELCQGTYASNYALADNAVRFILPPGDPLVADLCEHLWYVGNPSLRHLALMSLTRSETPDAQLRFERMKRMTPLDREEELNALDWATR